MSLSSGFNSIDSLVHNSWNTTAHTAVHVTYSFLAVMPAGASAKDANGFAPMNDLQRSAAISAMAAWSAVANVDFQQVASGGDIQLGTNDQGTESGGYSRYPHSDALYLLTNNTQASNFKFDAGSYGPSVLIHELGHTLGLKHPGNYNAGGGTVEGPYLPDALDNRNFSIMAYDNGPGWTLSHKYGITPMLYDILAIQYLYGPNMTYHTGADTYSFAKGAALQCVWDAGGNDTFDFSGCHDQTLIDLREGAFSSTAPSYFNISIAYNVTIENAVAGSGGSVIYANDAGNHITGGSGNDVIHEGAGSDVITGGGGSDTVVFAKGVSAYSLSGTAAALTVTGDGIDSLAGIGTLQFGNTVVKLADYALHVGSDGNDKLADAAGNELISGGAGVDVLTLSGTRASYALSSTGGTVSLKDLSGNGGTDLLTGVERLQFSDGAEALNVDVAAGQVFRLYSAMFNRVPDDGGLGFWMHGLDEGGSLVSMAAGFVNSAEFTAIYGANASDDTFVNALYHNVLHRDADAGGLQFWEGTLHSGSSRATVLVGFSDSAENIQVMDQVIPVGIPYIPYAG